MRHKATPKVHVYSFLFAMAFDFDFQCALIGLNLRVEELSSLQGSFG